MSSKTIAVSASDLQRRIKTLSDPEFRARQQRFSKEKLQVTGVPAPKLRMLAGEAAREWRRLKIPVSDIAKVADTLWKSGNLEQRQLAVFLLERFAKTLAGEQWRLFDSWIDSLSNWAETDALAYVLLSSMISADPTRARDLMAWTTSENRWRRRAAAVALTKIARKGLMLGEAFAICDRLKNVRDDMVEKAVGWLLKEASRTAPWSVAGFLCDRPGRYSRTTVRYACEKMPAALKEKVMREA